MLGLYEQLMQGEVELGQVIALGLCEQTNPEPGGIDPVRAMIMRFLSRLSPEEGITLQDLPEISLGRFMRQVGIPGGVDVARSHYLLAQISAWDDSVAKSEAEAEFNRQLQRQADDHKRYEAPLHRAVVLRTGLLELLPVLASVEDLEVRRYLVEAANQALGEVEGAIKSFESRLNVDPPKFLTGAEYKQQRIEALKESIAQANEAGQNRPGHEASAFRLLQSLARALRPA